MFNRNSFKPYLLTVYISYVLIIVWAIPSEAAETPHLRRQGSALQLVVDGKPFMVLGGELHNSSSSSIEYLRPIWPELARMNLNTVLAPVSWELIEPEQGRFDFALVDGLIRDARRHNLRVIFLWFASWKNSMSSYAPGRVKIDCERFPRALDKQGRGMEMLSALSNANCEADALAFAALMRHIRKVDGQVHTVVMIQVENEAGMIPEARDYSPVANNLFNEPVPKELMDYLQKHKDTLIPEFRQVWEEAGLKTSGTWQDVFGKGLGTDEIFMAWHYANYINRVAEAGKAEYELPMFVNAALIRPNYKPGQYPSAGPLPHLLDVWRAGGPKIDFFSPDIYFSNFAEWCQKYHRWGNPLFIPEAKNDAPCAVNVFYAIGQHDAIGFSPFGIDAIGDAEAGQLAGSYEVLSQLTPLILDKQGKGMTAGVLLDEDNQKQEVKLGNYTLNVSHDYTWKWTSRPSESEAWPCAGGIIIMVGPDEYVIAGNGIIVTFTSNSQEGSIAGIASIDEGTYVNGRWIAGRRLNGDENHQGRHLRLPNGRFGIQRIKLYRYR